MESKLEAYRLKKRREVMTNKTKESKTEVPLLKDCSVDKVSKPVEVVRTLSIKLPFNALILVFLVAQQIKCPDYLKRGICILTLKIERLQDLDDSESITSEGSIELSSNEGSIITKVIYFLYFLSWATLYIIALHYEFGAVYFIITALIFIWKNTRTSPKKKGEVSAYSVFNPNCEAIQGSINVEQLEREMGFGVPRAH